MWCHNLVFQKMLVSQGSMNISAAISMAMDVPHGSELNNSIHHAQVTKNKSVACCLYTRTACMCARREMISHA